VGIAPRAAAATGADMRPTHWRRERPWAERERLGVGVVSRIMILQVKERGYEWEKTRAGEFYYEGVRMG